MTTDGVQMITPFVQLGGFYDQMHSSSPPHRMSKTIQDLFRSIVESKALQQKCQPKERAVVEYCCEFTKPPQERYCQPILLHHASKELTTSLSLESIRSFCTTFEGELALKTKDQQFISNLYESIRRVMPDASPLARLSSLFSILRPYLVDSEVGEYDKLATAQLQAYMLQHPEDDLTQPIIELRSSGLPLQKIEEILSPRLEELEGNWKKFVDEHALFSTTDPDSLTVHISDVSQRLQERIAADTQKLMQLTESLPKHVQTAIICRATSLQGKAILDLTARAIDAHVAVVSKTEMSKEEYESTLDWMQKLEKDVKTYQSSSMAKEIDSIKRLSLKLTQTIQQIQKTLADFEEHPERHISRAQRAAATALKVASIAWRALKWLPYLALYVLPVAIATRAGYKAGGRRGALFAAGVATATTILSALTPLIAEKVVSEMATIPKIPASLRPTVGSICGLSIQIMSLIISMQLNGIIAGSLSSLTVTKPEENPATRPWYFQRLWNSAISVKDAFRNVTFGIPSFVAQEYGIATAALGSPEKYGAIFGRIANVAQAQIEANVAGYHLGEASVELPYVTMGLLGTVLGK